MSQAFSARVDSDSYVPFEAGAVSWMRQDDAVQSGFWRCTPEEQPDVHEAVFASDETVYIVEGRVDVEVVGDKTYELSAGSSASFLKWTTGRWKVIETVTEFFIYH